MSLAGVPDTQPPLLTSNENGTQIDPFRAVTLTASEPLPADTRLVLANLFDAPVVVTPTDPTAVVFTFFPSAGKLWRFDDRYTLMADSLVDFAGNRTTALFSFTTGPPPPLVAEDGFEFLDRDHRRGRAGAVGPRCARHQRHAQPLHSVAPGALGQRVERDDAARAPGGAGCRRQGPSLRLPDGQSGLGRVAVGAVLRDGVGRRTNRLSACWARRRRPTTTVTIPGGGQVSLGPLMTAEFALPPDAALRYRPDQKCARVLPRRATPIHNGDGHHHRRRARRVRPLGRRGLFVRITNPVFLCEGGDSNPDGWRARSCHLRPVVALAHRDPKPDDRRNRPRLGPIPIFTSRPTSWPRKIRRLPTVYRPS